jgi:hypothetical protein
LSLGPPDTFRKRRSEVDVDHVGDAPGMIDEHDVATNHVVAVVRRRGRQFGVEIGGHRVASRAPVMVEYKADLQAWLPVGRKPILNPKPDDWVLAMMFPPVAGDLAFVIVKLWVVGIPVVHMMILVVMILIVIILCVERAAVEQHEKRRDTHSNPPASFHSENLQFA